MIRDEKELAEQLEILYPMEPGAGDALAKWLTEQGVTFVEEPSVGKALVGSFIRNAALMDSTFLPYETRPGGHPVVRDARGNTYTMNADKTHGVGPTVWWVVGTSSKRTPSEMVYPVRVLWIPGGSFPVTGGKVLIGGSTVPTSSVYMTATSYPVGVTSASIAASVISTMKGSTST